LEPFFSFFFFLCSISLGLRSFDDIGGENHFFKNFFSIDLTWNCMVMTMDILAVDAYSRMQLCMPTWLNHDYEDGGVVDILVLDAYSGVEVCTPIFLGEASNFLLDSNSFLKKLKLKWTHPLTKLDTKKSCYVDNILLW
jgi:hypothetical protein